MSMVPLRSAHDWRLRPRLFSPSRLPLIGVAGTKYRVSELPSVELKDIAKPVEIVSVEWS
jgi:hypothetical protein